MNFTKVKTTVYLHNQQNLIKSPKIMTMNSYLLVNKNINTIVFKNINYQFIKNTILKDNIINRFISRESKLSIYHINSIISKLKYSGYFDNIQASYWLFKNCQHLVIQFHLNPVVKEIIINRANELTIPTKYLTSSLKRQIGNPKNFKLINRLINKIQNWYYVRGYRWVKILYTTPKSDLNKLEINIIESRITKINIICTNHKINTTKKYLELFILQTLNIHLGNNLNFYHIELGIIKLKTQKLITNCSYKVKYNSTETLKVTIRYYSLDKCGSYFFYRNIYLNNQLLDIIYCKLYKNFSHLLTSFNNFVYWKDISNTYLYFNKINQHKNTIYKHLILSSIIKIKDQYQKNQLINLHNSCKIKRYIDKLLIDFEKYSDKNLITTSCKHFGLQKKFYNAYDLSVCIFKNMYRIKSLLIKSIFQLNQYDHNFFSNFNVSYGTTILFTQNLLSNFYVSQKISFYSNSYEVKTLNYHNKWKKTCHFFELATSTIIRKCYKINQKFLSYKIKFYSNTITVKKLIMPRNTFNFSFQVDTPLIINFKELSKNNKINHFLNCQYTKIIQLSKSNLNNFIHTIIFHIELRFLYNLLEDIYINRENSSLLFDNYFRANISKKYLQTSLEYYIYKKYNTSLFIFFKYKHPFIKNNMYNLQNRDYQFKVLTYYIGTTAEIVIPINHIPIMQIKYEFNDNGISRLYTKFYVK